MNKFCNVCECEIPLSAKFCPQCGAAQDIGAPSGSVGPDSGDSTFRADTTLKVIGRDINNPQSNQQGGFAPYNHQGGYNHQNGLDHFNPQQNYNNLRNEKKIKFIFINAIVFSIIFAIRCLTSLASVGDWILIAKSVSASNIMSVFWFSLIMTIACFVSCLLLSIFAKSTTNKNAVSDEKIGAALKVFIMSIVALIAGSLYMFSEMSLLGYLSTIVNLGETRTALLGSIVFDIIFVIFATINIAKAKFFINDF